jgi:hypothetical protein
MQHMKIVSIIGLISFLVIGFSVGYYLGYDSGLGSGQDRAVEQSVTAFAFESDVIRVFTPLAQAVVESPVTIRGEAVGNWFFEASLPVTIVDSEDNNLGVGYVMTADEWMTTDFVSFEGTVSFTALPGTNGFILLQKDNPSGIPDLDDERRMPVRFK